MKKAISLALMALTSTLNAGCLEYGGSQDGYMIKIRTTNNDYSTAAPDPSMWMMNVFIDPAWYNWNWWLSPHMRTWMAQFPRQTMHMVFNVTKMSYSGQMVVGGQTATIVPGNVYNYEHQIEGCGMWANAHLDVRLYSTLPPIGTLMSRAQYWLNSN